MQPTKLILFDIIGVLVEYGDMYATASKANNIPQDLFHATFAKYADEMARGTITTQDLYLNTIKDNNLNTNPNYAFTESWVNDHNKIEPTYNLLLTLSEKYNIGLFSNMSKGMVPEMIKQQLIPDINYKYKFISGEMGLKKPEKNIYEYVLDQTKLQPSEIFYIDDWEECVITAKEMGFNAFSFKRYTPEISVNELKNILL